MPNLDSCYALLGLSRGASQEEIRDAFHRVAKQLYTDHSGPDTTARISTIYI